jgi:hypothetical protein
MAVLGYACGDIFPPLSEKLSCSSGKHVSFNMQIALAGSEKPK